MSAIDLKKEFGKVGVLYGGRSELVLGGLAIGALLGAGAVVATTTYGEEHLQLLAYPATLVAGVLIWRIHGLLGRRAGEVAAAVVVIFALWSSLKADAATDVSSVWRTSRPHSGGAIVLERARDPGAPATPYMVFGSNSENGHAAFLEEEFDLRCRYFHLYDFSRSEQFDETLECARREQPELVLVTLGFFDERSQEPTRWGAFVRAARQFLRTGYDEVDEEHPGFEAWKRREAST